MPRFYLKLMLSISGALLLSMMLTACSGIPQTETNSSGSCMLFCKLTFSASSDTPETVSQIRKHNAAVDAVCEVEESEPRYCEEDYEEQTLLSTIPPPAH